MTDDQAVPDNPNEGWDVSGFIQQFDEAVDSLTNGEEPETATLEAPVSVINALLTRLGLPAIFPEDEDSEPDPTPWKTLVESQLEIAQTLLPDSPIMTVLPWLVGDYNIEHAKYKRAESTEEADHARYQMCVYLSRIVAVACFFNKKYKPDYSKSSRGHKKTVDLLLLRTAQHRWEDMGDIAARRLYTLMTGVK